MDRRALALCSRLSGRSPDVRGASFSRTGSQTGARFRAARLFTHTHLHVSIFPGKGQKPETIQCSPNSKVEQEYHKLVYVSSSAFPNFLQFSAPFEGSAQRSFISILKITTNR